MIPADDTCGGWRWPGVGATPEHGGALTAATARFGVPAAGWLDLSTGINPWPYPFDIAKITSEETLWTRLPDAAALMRLRTVAATAYGLDPAQGATHVVAAPGTQALLQLLPLLWRDSPVTVLGFTYAGHAHAWRHAGHHVTIVPRPAAADAEALLALATPGAVLVLVNPNNPDGTHYPPAPLLALAARLGELGGLLVVDEAFADPLPNLSLAPAVGMPGLCVLRSFGKFFGLAGVRLGFALGWPALIARLESGLGPWAVSGPTLAVGMQALVDRSWSAATRQRLVQAAAALDTALAGCGVAVLGGTPLFRLIAHPDAAQIFIRCAQQGVLVRAFDARPDWLRIGLPPAGVERLLAAIGTYPA